MWQMPVWIMVENCPFIDIALIYYGKEDFMRGIYHHYPKRHFVEKNYELIQVNERRQWPTKPYSLLYTIIFKLKTAYT